jgi:GT2 family glycosyltransferase
MYTSEDISVVIATYNRADDLKTTLDSITDNSLPCKEIIIVDQSKDTKTRDLIRSLKNNKLKYYYSDVPSLTKARNIGATKVFSDSKIVCFFDDDVTLEKDYFRYVLEIFNTYSCAQGVGGFITQTVPQGSRLEVLSKKIFFLGHLEKNAARVLSVYGNTYPSKLTKVINSEWLSGVNMCYKLEVLKDQQFDENLSGYALAEDLDFSYRLNRKYGNSLFITPYARLMHRASVVERIPSEKMVYTNQINHFYLNFKDFNKTISEKLIFAWAVSGIAFLRIMQFLIKRNLLETVKLKLFVKSLVYCLGNLKKIRHGILSYDVRPL